MDKLLETLLNKINASYTLEEQSIGDKSDAKVNMMTFHIRSFDAKGLGHVSLMTGKDYLGLMKMETLIINSFNKDMPLLSYDRIHVLNIDKVFLDMFETRIHPMPIDDSFASLKETYADIESFVPKECWYTSILLASSIYKNGRKSQSERLDTLVTSYFSLFLQLAEKATDTDYAQKKKKASVYTEGLIENGGASTDSFIKAKGKEYTADLFRNVLFGTK